MSDNNFSDYIDWMGVNDPELEPHDGERKMVEPGEYDFEITEVKQDQSRAGKPTLIVTASVLSGAAKGRTIRNWYSLVGDNEFARRRIKALIQATGVPVDGRGAFSAQAFVGCKFHGKVIEDTFTARNQQGVEEERTWSKITCEAPIG
ncbi:MAG: DUF669 domain-containing protein [Gemmatimonadota bacterium]|nr:MAG: DUF669 domain-containing protein [Gemmatimonadota bacterium]